ncbi:acyltransferase family protein [Oryzicola mucosus]|uniref:Acyltransferase n=1 Tax=Oryzicola mucosus TaxID=2767425 RepID=A0A8J6PK23_9HYPH|nr:acyltransferase family protein [Oryzicola mucosus]MBD0416494.1 acyltransferase [Oryzicola mucosus]
MSSIRVFRPEVQGLRALAVLSVVFYHLGWTWIEGGFVGVDVFFVISGFLITGIIKRGTEAGRFDYWQFSVGRVRRLYPALVVTLALTFTVGACLLSPAHLQEFGRSMVWALGSLSNWFYLMSNGYFGTEAIYQPLLHTWSLGVEVQFYVVWPVFIWAAVKFLPTRLAFAAVGLAALASLGLAEFWIISDHADAAFFQMPARIVEFAIGGLLVWFIDRKPADARILEPLATVGAAMIIYSVLTYREEMRFPGLTALIPCLGSALIIYAGSARWAGWLFRTRPAVYIGNISYALYLVHWPVIVFYSYYKFLPRTLGDDAIILAICIAMAAVLHALVEKPFQQNTVGRLHLSQPVLLGGLAALIVALAVPAQSAGHSGWGWRLSEQQNKWLSQVGRPPTHKSPNVRGDVTSTKRILVIGDSHAMHLLPMISQYFGKKKYQVVYLGYRCVPLPEVTRWVDGRPMGQCTTFHRDLTKIIKGKKYDAIIAAARWTSSLTGRLDDFEKGVEGRSFFLTDKKNPQKTVANSHRVFEDGVRRLIKAVDQAKVPLLIFGQVPPAGINLAPCLPRAGTGCKPAYSKQQVSKRLQYSNAFLFRAARKSKYASFANPLKTMCSKSKDYCPVFFNDVFLFSDAHHLSYAGSVALTPKFSHYFDALLKRVRKTHKIPLN